jgi:phosphopantothenoylcysteine synthetase/decarboxylase
MNPAMWNHPAVQMNIKQLAEWGVHIVPPGNGTVVCGEQGVGRLASIEVIGAAACNVTEK